jgi:hypothetical protein
VLTLSAERKCPICGASLSLAHFYLAAQTGIPHGGTFIEQLLQEMFAMWVQYRDHVLTGRVPKAHLKTYAVPRMRPVPMSDLSPELGRHLGKHIASAELGSRDNQRHLRVWMNDPGVDAGVKKVVRDLRSALYWDASPTFMASALGEIYDGLSGCQR